LIEQSTNSSLKRIYRFSTNSCII